MADKGVTTRETLTRYRDAWEACNEFISGIASHPPAAKDRYTTLLYDVPARRLQEKIVEQAGRAFEEAIQEAAALDEITGFGYGELLVKDLNGNDTFCHATDAWVMKWPKVERGKESGTIVWVFDCAAIEISPRGNLTA